MTYGTFYTPTLKKSDLPSDHPTVPSDYAGRGCPVASRTDKEHEFRAPGAGDVRSVCPALNAMANHGYIPRDGRNLTFATIFSGLQACYNISTPLTILLTVGGFLLIKRLPFALPFGLETIFSSTNPDGSKIKPGVIDLHLIGRHNGTEHDASLVHEDCPPDSYYPSIEIIPEWVENLVGDVRPEVEGYPVSRKEKPLSSISTSSTPSSTISKKTTSYLAPPDDLEDDTRSPSRGPSDASSVTAVDIESDTSLSSSSGWKKFTGPEYQYTLVSADDVGRMRARRQREILPKKLDGMHEEIARGEMGIILEVWERETFVENDGTDPVSGEIVKRKKGIPLPWLLTWLAEERLPSGWKPSHVVGLLDVVKRNKAIKLAAQAEEAKQSAS
ncbi:Cloroperoxidase [Moniliophthora roreri MCA 2997]|uniref:Cloroperoxidase n=1 Tax=Moniliophthora roreri (strain MCA 2997) TaxID=1381753 RepID=V2WY05_MONRO|nr:Cloroperoxidase [Moniliophthora roreri MCA 2997]